MFNEQDAWPMPVTEASSRRSYDPSEVFAVNNTSLMLEEPALTVRMLVLSVPTSIMIPELSLSLLDEQTLQKYTRFFHVKKQSALATFLYVRP